MLDENGNWIPDDPYQPPLLSQAQKTAKEVFGIGSSGPMAEQATATANDFNAGRHESFDRLGQNMPQQYGMAETTDNYTDDLKTPGQAVESFMQQNYTPDSAHRAMAARQRGPETPDQILARNSAYQEKAAADRSLRDTERNRLREQGAMNRAASREKDADMWAQFRDMGSLQGAARPAQFNGGPMAGAQNVGGAILLPGMGAPPGGRYGLRNYDPLGEQKLELRKQQEGRLQGQAVTAATQGQQKIELGNAKVKGAQDTLNERKRQFEARMNAATEKDARELQAELDSNLAQLRGREAVADQESGSTFQENVNPTTGEKTKTKVRGKDFAKYLDAVRDPRTGKLVVSEPGSYEKIARDSTRIADKLDEFHQNHKYDFKPSDPDLELLMQLKQSYR